MVIPLITPATEGALLVPYPATLDVPYELVEHVSWLLYEHRRQANTRWRKLAPGAQAVIVLAVLRHDQRLADMASGNHVSASTVRRWVLEQASPCFPPGPRGWTGR
ncbi:hypothetical protein [Streptomyces capitiformicae]|uniref:Uncharacterized protein n=1 Tax=Streptomyces capitiformicae TaxID=2014920 RepID=A0A918Z9T0_9ACTN|nr:hypothetical protein [Streptomyces capitiformicae]GHE41676.1 hypothetical protein GCM10017771_61030 [Streptomyces capitiformicae]